MDSQTSTSAIVKRVNLLILIIIAVLSCILGYELGSSELRGLKFAASRTTWKDSSIPIERGLESVSLSTEEQVALDFYNADKELYDLGAMPADQSDIVKVAIGKRLSKISLVGPILYGLSFTLGIFSSAIVLMMTISWVLGYKFKLHISLK